MSRIVFQLSPLVIIIFSLWLIFTFPLIFMKETTFFILQNMFRHLYGIFSCKCSTVIQLNFTVHHKGRTSAIEDDMTDIAMSKHVLRNDKCCFLFKHWPFNCNNWRRYKIRPSQLGQHESVKLAWFIFAPLSMLSIMFLLSRKNKLCTSLKSGHQTRWANSASYFTEVW